MTRKELIELTKAQNPKYFSEGNLNFFGQTMEMFKFNDSYDIPFLFAESYWNHKLMGYSIVAYFNLNVVTCSLRADLMCQNIPIEQQIYLKILEEIKND